MTRRQLLVSLSVPAIVAALAAAFVLTSSATADPGCAPGSGCCLAPGAIGASGLGNTAATPAAAADECGPGACCVPSCCGAANDAR